MCLTLSRSSINVSPSLLTNGPHHGSNLSCCVNICPVFLAINSHPGALCGITEVPVCKGDWGFLTLAEIRVIPPSPFHNLRKTSRCSQLASAGTIDPMLLKATNQWNTTKAYRLRKGTLQVQSEDRQLQQPLHRPRGRWHGMCAVTAWSFHLCCQHAIWSEGNLHFHFPDFRGHSQEGVCRNADRSWLLWRHQQLTVLRKERVFHYYFYRKVQKF